VIIIIAILAGIAIPTFLGQRQKAQDAAAKSLVRNAMTAIESAYVDTRTFAVGQMTAAVLNAIEPSITFTAAGSAGAAYHPNGEGENANNNAAKGQVQYFGGVDNYQVGTKSESGKTFGVSVNKGAGSEQNPAGNTFYIDGAPKAW